FCSCRMDPNDGPIAFVGGVVLVALGLCSNRLGEYLRKLSVRIKTPTATEILAWDKRPPILFLRTFEDDQIGPLYVRVTKESEHRIGYYQDLELVSFEQMLFEMLAQRGPVIAIGQP